MCVKISSEFSIVRDMIGDFLPTENPFDENVIDGKISEINAALDGLPLSEENKRIREWIPSFYTHPLERRQALSTLLKRATGTPIPPSPIAIIPNPTIQ